MLVETVEKHFKGFLPMIMITRLKTGKPVEVALARRFAEEARTGCLFFRADGPRSTFEVRASWGAAAPRPYEE